ncbi:alanine-glyoxylate aminotransferase AGT2 [Fusarium acutatum]|uniref:Alanine-glyoxylate aminotransferase AGT2 n=1 Tax=Fusarium acutatum TaxID=78861 RepID=A0A8H4NQA6_9HYPO|nr:alanine-glyoxylate aminotransferase AGT2 [Fusarium acutatum]
MPKGSEAVEAAMKLDRQNFLEKDPGAPRSHFIDRQNPWHGCTMGASAVGDLKARKEPFLDVLANNVSHVSPCHPYRDLEEGETEEQYVIRLAKELDDEFQRIGPENVCAFILEPMVGTALGCVTALPGYLAAIKAVCHRHGALIIFNEVMCGLGRTGHMHAWQYDGVVPDIQAVGKGLDAGYGTISAPLIHDHVIDGLKQGSASFQHGQTYQCHPLNVVAALEVQRIIQDGDLVRNACLMGILLGHLLHRVFDSHPNVGQVRGRGMFWYIEFVADKATKRPLDPKLNLARRMRLRGLEKGYNICLFPSTGCNDGWNGDHFLLAPPFTVTPPDVEEIIYRASRVVYSVFEEVRAKAIPSDAKKAFVLYFSHARMFTNEKKLTPPFTVEAGPGTDIWRKPGHDAWSIPDVHTVSDPLKSFVSARVTFSAKWKNLYDKSGIVLAPSKASESAAPHSKWIKSGIELYAGKPHLSIVACDRFADMSLYPVAATEGQRITLQVAKEGGNIWVFQPILDDDGSVKERMPLREICWILCEEQDDWVLDVGALAARQDCGRSSEG